MPLKTSGTLKAAHMAFDHPEIEKADHSLLTSHLGPWPSGVVKTAVDVLEVNRELEDASAAGGSSDTDSDSESTRGEEQQPPGGLVVEASSGRYVYRKNLSHNKLVRHLEASRKGKDEPALRIIFLKNKKSEFVSSDPDPVALSPQTIEYLIKDVGVSPIFFSCITRIHPLLDAGNALLKKWNSAGNLVSIQGFYRYSRGVRGHLAHLWFLHNLEKRTSTYIIHSGSKKAQRDIVKWAADDRLRPNLLRPVAIDSLIMDQVAWSWSGGVVASADKLVFYEHLQAADHVDGFINNAVYDLHKLSQHFHIMHEELNCIVEKVNYLLEIHAIVDKAAAAPSPPQAAAPEGDDENTQCTTSVADSLSFLRSRTKIWQRWVLNWRERTNIRINLFFNLSAQRDNRTNLRIADLTTKIAQETQRDSSSMITIAALTLVFLPGTFVAAIFSMVFFNTSDVTTGVMSMTVAPGWWVYPTITIPFTIIVVTAWNMWRTRRDKKQREAMGPDWTGEGPPMPLPAVPEYPERDSVMDEEGDSDNEKLADSDEDDDDEEGSDDADEYDKDKSSSNHNTIPQKGTETSSFNAPTAPRYNGMWAPSSAAAADTYSVSPPPLRGGGMWVPAEGGIADPNRRQPFVVTSHVGAGMWS